MPPKLDVIPVEEELDFIPVSKETDDLDVIPISRNALDVIPVQEVQQLDSFQRKIQVLDPTGNLPSDQLSKKLPPPVNSQEKSAFDAEVERRRVREKDLKDLRSGKQPKKKDVDFNPNMKQAQKIDVIMVNELRNEATVNPQLARFYQSLNAADATIARLPALAVDIIVLPANILERAVGYGPGNWSSAEWLIDNPIAEYYDDAERAWSLVSTDQKFKDESLSSLIDKKDLSRAGEFFVHQYVANVPNQLMVLGAALMGAPGAAVLIGMGSMEASRANKENRDKEIDAVTSTVNALLKRSKFLFIRCKFYSFNCFFA